MGEIEEFAGKLFDLARAGDDALLAYIAHGVNPNLVNQNGDSFVMLAAYSGHAQLVHKLISAGADPDLVNDRGQSPLAGAVFKKEDAVIDVLVDAGADTTQAAEFARMFGRTDLLARFIQ
ncbi:MAG: ankyrin repeat domain-containing protein [Corynebacterium sp.]|nr:ankyrin repeat domain-containing protein [Corynebacterium sp.]